MNTPESYDSPRKLKGSNITECREHIVTAWDFARRPGVDPKIPLSHLIIALDCLVKSIAEPSLHLDAELRRVREEAYNAGVLDGMGKLEDEESQHDNA